MSDQAAAKKHVIVYTDGACSGNPGPGGWGVVLSYGGKSKELSGSMPNTTNNRMELFAVISALGALKEPCVVAVFSDSTYVVNAFEKGWIDSWQKNNWIKSDKKPVENSDLWKLLLQLIKIKKHEMRWGKVKGHSDDPLNNRCDELARAAIKDYRRMNGETVEDDTPAPAQTVKG